MVCRRYFLGRLRERQMLSRTNKDAAYCYQRAEESRRIADRTGNPVLRRECEEMEIRWLGLARSYEFAANLNTFVRTQIKG
jgi:hypothetical protein